MSERKWSEIFALFSTGEVLLGQPPGSGEENDGFWGGGPKRGGVRGGYPGGGGENATSAHIFCARNPPIYTVFKARIFTFFHPSPIFPEIGENTRHSKSRAAKFAPHPELQHSWKYFLRKYCMLDIADWSSVHLAPVCIRCSDFTTREMQLASWGDREGSGG